MYMYNDDFIFIASPRETRIIHRNLLPFYRQHYPDLIDLENEDTVLIV